MKPSEGFLLADKLIACEYQFRVCIDLTNNNVIVYCTVIRTFRRYDLFIFFLYCFGLFINDRCSSMTEL